jgi:hypothetical protein
MTPETRLFNVHEAIVMRAVDKIAALSSRLREDVPLMLQANPTEGFWIRATIQRSRC